MSRKNAREKAYQVLFGIDFENNIDQWKQNLEEMQKEWDLSTDDINFVNVICEGVSNSYKELESLLQENLKGYKISQLYTSDRVVLLIALFELKHTQTPKEIVVNEAVEISKKYGIEKSPKFVNGVLAGVLKSL